MMNNVLFMACVLLFRLALVSSQVIHASALEHVVIAADGKGFHHHPSSTRFVPWGQKYSSVDILERMANDPARIQREFDEMKAADTTVVKNAPFLAIFA